VSPGGEVAGIAPGRLVRVGTDGRVRSARLPSNVGGEVAWSNGRIVFLPRWSAGSALVYDARLRPVGRFAWASAASAVRGGRAYGVNGMQLASAELPDGPARVVRALPGPVTHALVPAD
jgi:hypothetical protein